MSLNDRASDTDPKSNKRASADPRAVVKRHFEELGAFLDAHAVQFPTAPPLSSKQRVSRLTKQEFHELSTDVYDDLLRRKNQASFLPLREDFHWRRILARSELAQLDVSRFEALCSDVYVEIQRRHPELRGAVTTESHTKVAARGNTPSEGRRSEEPRRPRRTLRPRDSVTPDPLALKANPSPPPDAISICSTADTISSSDHDQQCQNASHTRMQMYYEYKVAMMHKAWKQSQAHVVRLEDEVLSLRLLSEEQSASLSRLQIEVEDLRGTRPPIKANFDDELQLLRDHNAQLCRDKEVLVALLNYVASLTLMSSGAELGAFQKAQRQSLVPQSSISIADWRFESKPLIGDGVPSNNLDTPSEPGLVQQSHSRDTSTLTLVNGMDNAPSPSSSSTTLYADPGESSEWDLSSLSDDAWATLQLYVRVQIKNVTSSLHNILAGAQGSTPVSIIKDDVDQLIAIVSSIVACCRGNFPQGLMQKGNDLLDELNEHANELSHVYSKVSPSKGVPLALANSSLGIFNTMKVLTDL